MNRFDTRQKWQLALSLLVIYYPVLLYLDFPVHSPDHVLTLRILGYQTLTGLLIFLMYRLWISLSDWVLTRLINWFGEAFVLAFNLPAQLLIACVACCLSITFVIATRETIQVLDTVFIYTFGQPFSVPLPSRYSAEFWYLYKRANIGFFFLLMLSGFYLLAIRRINGRLKESALIAQKLDKERIQAQFDALKNQVNPHFLFNSLNILASLVYENAALAEQFIHRLASAYRYILEQNGNEWVALRTELDFLETYVFLLNIRFEDRLVVTYQLSKTNVNRYRVAPLTLQLLLENAVKHNQMSQESPLRVQIGREQDDLVITNNRQPRSPAEASTGMGLPHIISRYRLLTDRPVRVETDTNRFTVRLPLLI